MANGNASSSTSTSTLGNLDGERIQVVTASNGAYLPYVATMLRSLGARDHGATGVDLTVLHGGVSPRDRKRATPTPDGRLSVRWVEVTDELVERALARPVADELPPAYFRLLLGAVLPAAGRAIYLDADTVVNADLGELWRRDLGGAIAGAVVDYLVRCRDAVGNWRELGLDGDAAYYNTGVLLVNLDAWRSEDVGAHAFAACRENAEHLLARGEFAQHDQYGLNVVLQGRWHTLGSLWNWGSELAESPARIVHYVGNGKPHDPRCRPRFRELFLEHLDATAWAGWLAYEPADAGTTFA
jgi:lipopolysaccharide biosynthesis glycosyltransferase